jgi:hypothetical protein
VTNDDIFIEKEAEFHKAVLEAVANGKHDLVNGTMRCPIL